MASEARVALLNRYLSRCLTEKCYRRCLFTSYRGMVGSLAPPNPLKPARRGVVETQSFGAFQGSSKRTSTEHPV